MQSANSLQRLLHYCTDYLPNNLTAGLWVFLTGLYLCLGIALASGTPLFAGLVAGIIGGIVVRFNPSVRRCGSIKFVFFR